VQLFGEMVKLTSYGSVFGLNSLQLEPGEILWKNRHLHLKIGRALSDVLQMTEEAGSLFQGETKLETNPKVGFCWMRKGRQKPLRTPGTNRKVWRLHWVSGERKDGELFSSMR
jgi:hypothetical protein